MNSRRTFLRYSATLAAGTALPMKMANASTLTVPDGTPENIAQDEAFWTKVAGYYDIQSDIINLEQGYWGKMANPVQEAFFNHTRKINHDMSWYARKQYGQDFARARVAVAEALNVSANEIMLTRNATESFVNIITQFNQLQPEDSILWADIDYPSYQEMLAALVDKHKLAGHELTLPTSGTEDDYIAVYEQAFKALPNLKLMLLTHVSNQHGLVMPVKRIAQLARQHGIYVICDCAQSWGLLNFTLDDLDVDWAIFNLHKWIGSPVGVGALFMRTGSMSPVSPFLGEDPGDDDVANRVHLATSDFASFLTVEDALRFHHNLGGANKEARLRYLWQNWTTRLRNNPGIEILGAADLANASGMGGFRLTGQTSVEENMKLQQTLEQQYGIFTVVRKALNAGANIRITPQVFTPVDHMHKLADTLIKLAKP